jgi:uncharacterized protein YbjT (DUF2867 family)
MAGTRTALIAGATGLVGGECLTRLLNQPRYERVIAFVRRPLPASHAKLDQRVIDFDALATLPDFPRCDDVFCCLGTTMKKAKGSEEAFRQVDFVYVVNLAQRALAAGAKQFLLVSAIGAGSKSPIFYNRVKGEVEEAIARMGYPGYYVFRPSILAGDRPEHRPAERLGLAVASGVSLALVGPLRKYRPIQAETVAEAMVRVALKAQGGVNVYASDVIERLAQE